MAKPLRRPLPNSASAPTVVRDAKRYDAPAEAVTASAGASYRFASRTTLGADALFGSGLRSGFANSAHLPGYTQVNASLAQAFDFGGGLGKLEGRLSVLNVFDRVYELRDGTGIGVGAPQFGPRRAVYASVTKTF